MPPPPDDDRAVDDASQALSDLSTNVNDFLRMQAKVGAIPYLVERLPAARARRAVVVHTSGTMGALRARALVGATSRPVPRAARRRRAEQAAEPRIDGAGGAQG